ncbi:MAG: protein kinase [Deltaproteobacteria bacterium]|nr:protein kinase [Deltaproteobacteria bacterium]
MSVEITEDVPLSLAPPPTGPDAVPRRFGRYTLLHHLARGGMGEVYLAVVGDLRGFERICVVKTVRPEYARQRSFVERFLDEGQLLTRLSHGHIAQVLDVGRHEDEYFLALEYVEGKDLAKTIDRLSERQQPMPVAVALHVGIAVLDALAYAHARKDRDGRDLGLIHRDVSPQNVLVSYEGDVKLIDFGNALTEVRRHATAAGIIYGKPGYIAPEQARGEKPDRRSDLYAMGVTLWEILTAKRLLAEDLDTFLPRLRKGKVKPPPLARVRDDVPSEIDRIIAKAMAPDREARYPDAAAFRADLASALAAFAPGVGPATVAELMQEIWTAEIAVERRLTGQLLERAPGAITNPIEIPSSPGAGPAGGSSTRYRILRKLGEGAMGEVFAAEHIDLEKVVALKVLHRDFSQNQAFVERFRREARAVAKIGHPNIVQVTDFGETADGRVFFAMEKLDGESLESRLSRTGFVPEEDALCIAEAICQALVAAHGEGIVHRDLKPDNVFLCSDGNVKLLDFGVAKTMGLGPEQKLTRAGEIWGTPEYMAPEQAANRGVDARTDLYAVGAMLYEMVTGSLPFRGASAIEILHSQIHDPPEAPSRRAPERAIRIATERVILRSLGKDPAGRFPSAEVMAAEVHAALLSRARRSSAGALWAAGTIVGVLGVFGALAGWRILAPGALEATVPPAAGVTAVAAEPAPSRPVAATPASERSTPVSAVTAPAATELAAPPELPKPPGQRVQRDPITEALLNARRLRERGDREGAVRASHAILLEPGGRRLDVQLFYVEALWASGRREEAKGTLRQVARRHSENRRVQDLMQQYGVSP